MTERLVVKGLSKQYGTFTALAPTDLTLQAGETAILSGQNGSGKTTLLTCLANLVKPSSGSVTVDSYDMAFNEIEVRKRLVFVPDVQRFYVTMTAWEHLRFIAMANDVLDGFDQRAEALLKEFGLWHTRDHFPHNYSRGMKLKLSLVMAFIRPFTVLLLDEPTSALDEESVELLLGKIGDLREQGTSILMSSHNPLIKQQFGDRQFLVEEGVLKEI
ncbi:MAG: ABC transporter ATP-binding protein [Anaerolineaceae bacterium]|nr:ABC transporter ATP-binding protein [Anaerolineaceae bacterium]